MSENEQDKSKEATPFKLRKAREKGNVGKGAELGFFVALVAGTLFLSFAGPKLSYKIVETTKDVYVTFIPAADDPQRVLEAISILARPVAQSLALLFGTIVLFVIAGEIIQIRGVVLSAHPLKPDFKKLNPIKGIKKLFSQKMLKDALKNILKMTFYSIASYLIITMFFKQKLQYIVDVHHLIEAISTSSLQLLYVCIGIAFFFMIIDQLISRQEFKKQMKMSNREVKRENKDLFGEPRIKQKRKELHQEFAKQTKAISGLDGSDLLIVNPEHFAVALTYTPKKMKAPEVKSKGRNQLALHLKRKAALLSIPIVSSPVLARKLYRTTEVGEAVPSDCYHDVAAIYLKHSKAKK